MTLEELESGKGVDPFELAGMWTANNDARNAAIVGSRPYRSSSDLTYNKKDYQMSKHLLKAAVVAMVGIASAAAAQQSGQDFTLINMTGDVIEQLRISPSRHARWGQDVLGSQVLQHRQYTQIVFSPLNDTCVYDFMVAYGDGSQVQWGGLDLCSISVVELFYNPYTRETWAETQ